MLEPLGPDRVISNVISTRNTIQKFSTFTPQTVCKISAISKVCFVETKRRRVLCVLYSVLTDGISLGVLDGSIDGRTVGVLVGGAVRRLR